MNEQHKTLSNNCKVDQANDKKAGSLLAPFCLFAPVVEHRVNNIIAPVKR